MRYLTGTILSRLEPIRGSERAASRIARSVAIALVGAVSIGVTPAESGSIDAIQPKDYIRIHYSKDEALCLIRLYGKESAFNPRAIGNEDGTHKAYGIPQLKNPIIKDLSANRQIDYGMKYLKARYSNQPCKALKHSRLRGWY